MFRYFWYSGSIVGDNAKAAYDLYDEYIEKSDGCCCDFLEPSRTQKEKWHIWREIDADIWCQLPLEDRGVMIGNTIVWYVNVDKKIYNFDVPSDMDLACTETLDMHE